MAVKAAKIADPVVEVVEKANSVTRIHLTSNGSIYVHVEGVLKEYNRGNLCHHATILDDVCVLHGYDEGLYAICAGGKIFACYPSDSIDEPNTPEFIAVVDVLEFIEPLRIVFREDLNLLCVCSSDGKYSIISTSEFSENDSVSNNNSIFTGPLNKSRVISDCRIWGTDPPVLVMAERGSDLFLSALGTNEENLRVLNNHASWVTALSEGSYELTASADCTHLNVWRVSGGDLHVTAEQPHDGIITSIHVNESSSLLWCANESIIECYAVDAARGCCELLRLIGLARFGGIDTMFCRENELIAVDANNATITYYPIHKQLVSLCCVSLEQSNTNHCSLCEYVPSLQVVAVVNQHGTMSIYHVYGKLIRDIKNTEASDGRITCICHEESSLASAEVVRAQLFIGYSSGKVASLLLTRTQASSTEKEPSLTALDLLEPTLYLPGDESNRSGTLDIHSASIALGYKCPLAVTRAAVSEKWLVLSHMHYAIFVYSRSQQRVVFQVDLPDMLQDFKYIRNAKEISHLLLVGKESCNVLCLSSFAISHAVHFTSLATNEIVCACSLTNEQKLLEDDIGGEDNVGLVLTSNSSIYSFSTSGVVSLISSIEVDRNVLDPTGNLPIDIASFIFDDYMYCVCSFFRFVVVLRKVDTKIVQSHKLEFENSKARVITAQVLRKEHSRRFELVVGLSNGYVHTLWI